MKTIGKIMICLQLFATSSAFASSLNKILAVSDENSRFEMVEGLPVPELKELVLEANSKQSSVVLLGINALGRKDPKSLRAVVGPIVNGSMDSSKVLLLRNFEDYGLEMDNGVLESLAQKKSRVDVRMEAWAVLARKGNDEARLQAFDVLENYKGPDDIMGFNAAARVFEDGCDKVIEKKLEKLATSAKGWRRPPAVIAWCTCALKNSRSEKDKEVALWPALGDRKSDRPRKWALRKAILLEPTTRKRIFDKLLSDPAHPAHHEAKALAARHVKSPK